MIGVNISILSMTRSVDILTPACFLLLIIFLLRFLLVGLNSANQTTLSRFMLSIDDISLYLTA